MADEEKTEVEEKPKKATKEKPKKATKKKAKKPAKKAKSEDKREALLQKLFISAYDKYDGKLLEYATDVKIERGVPRVSTGILPMDLATGGGMPIGRISLLFGHKSTSKTANLLRAAGMA